MFSNKIVRGIVAALSLVSMLAFCDASFAKGGGKGGGGKGGKGGHSAGHHGHHGHHAHHGHHRSHHRGYNNWGFRRFDARYGCTLYYDQDARVYYYWCQPDDCYLPVDQCPYGKYSWNQ